MLRLTLILAVLAAPGFAQTVENTPNFSSVSDGESGSQRPVIKMIEAKGMSLEDLRALAALERDNANGLQCCDWGGGCVTHSAGS